MEPWNGAIYPNVVELFVQQTQQTPRNTALRDEAIEYTFETLNEKANQLAHALLARQIKKNDFVAILLDPGAEYIVVILAVIKIGAVYIPLDSQAPQERLKKIIQDAQPELVITDNKYYSSLPDNEQHIVLIKKLHLESISCSIDNPSVLIEPQSPIYMMYTSGSTGQPKGVIITHQAVVNLSKAENYAQVKQGEIIAQFSNLAFDGSTFEIWSALLNGATLSVIPLASRTNHIELTKTLKKNKIAYLFLPTGFFHQLIKSEPQALDSVRVIVFGGEQVNKNLVKNFLNHRAQHKIPLELINGYGPTEATTFTCKHVMNEHSELNDDQLISIGSVIANVKTYILDEQHKECAEGELYISGINLAWGYHNSEQNQKKFIPNPFVSNRPYERLYSTGDKVRRLPSGELLCLGRLDDQVKIGGFRIHLNEIEQTLLKHPDIAIAAVIVELGGGQHKILTAYLVLASESKTVHVDDIRTFLSLSLPPYMLPAKYVKVAEMPLTRVGKIDKTGLDKIPHTDLSFHIDTSSSSLIEETIKNVWMHLLNRNNIQTHKNLFDLGANSLLITEACFHINQKLKSELEISDLLAHPTIHKLSRYLEGDIEQVPTRKKTAHLSSDIAIIGMSCRFPKANNVDEFWNNLCQGNDCLTRFEPEQIDNEASLNKNYVPVRGVLSGIEQFDASFFGFSPVDANITDPQQRLFLECAWEALEHAAVAPAKAPSKIISVFAGMTDTTYLHEHLLKNHWFCNEHDHFQQRIATSMGMLSTQVSYRFNLTGRSINLNTACSTGLITVDQACQDLIMGQSDIALAGASSIILPQISGYSYQQGSIVSPDGCCRPFAENANGTVFSNGVGVVVLKRLCDAIQDKDTIYAVIKSSSVNNDGSDKLGFTAPSLNGQKACVREALAQAGISAQDVEFIEAHGTATALGDVIEINALTSVYREHTEQQGYCALGSVKGNIGHTDVAAGIAGLIKTALCLYHKKIPPLIHFDAPNPNLMLETSPFYINSALINWESKATNRHAGVSAFGVGGTNIHMILAEHTKNVSEDISQEQEQLLLFSAKTQQALNLQIHKFYEHMRSKNNSSNQWSNAAYTLQTGREDFQWRQFLVSKNLLDFQSEMGRKKAKLVDEHFHHGIVLMFSGQGTQYPQMAMELYNSFPLFQEYINKGTELAKPYLKCDLLKIICNLESSKLTQTEYAQPALFIIEYALARFLMDCGIKPDALIGHSIGEYVAACLAEVFSFEDGIALVCERGLLMAQAVKGEMLALDATEEEIQAFKDSTGVDLALHNATNHYVLAGRVCEIAQMERHLTEIGKPFHKLKVSHAFHSKLMESLELPFKEIFTNITLSPPKIPIVSNVTGDWLSASEALDPDYWYRHLRHTVQFCNGIKLLLCDKHPLFVEVGLGQSLCEFVNNISGGTSRVTHILPNHRRQTSDLFQLQTCLGELWTNGVGVQPQILFEPHKREHIELPTYPFQKQRHWIEPDKQPSTNKTSSLYKPVWSYKALITSLLFKDVKLYDWIIFTDNTEIGQNLIELLLQNDITPIIIESGTYYTEVTPFHFKIDIANESNYTQFMDKIKNQIERPVMIHCFSCGTIQDKLLEPNQVNAQLDKSFYSLLYATKAYANQMGAAIPMRCVVITSGTLNVLGMDKICPVNASLIGSCRVISLERPTMSYQLVDIEPNDFHQNIKKYCLAIIAGCLSEKINLYESVFAYRNGYKWDINYSSIENHFPVHSLPDNGIYLITGGLGGLGLSMCEAIATHASHPTLILCSRTASVPESEWDRIIDDHSHSYHHKIIYLKKLQALGSKIFWFQLDVSNPDGISSLFELIQKKFGALNGIIHSAGIAGGGLTQLKSKEIAHGVLSPKIHGTYQLAKGCEKLPPLDFVVLMSSIAAITGEKGQIDYCGANACLDAFSRSNLFRSKLTISINWNTWREVGMSIDTKRPNDLDLFERGNSISPQQGQSLFLKALSCQYSNIVISNYDLQEYTALLHEDKFSPSITKNNTSRDVLDLGTIYSSPANKMEQQLAQIWQELLHIGSIGIHDDFFALGGHSLKAINLIEKINTLYNSSLSIQQLYQFPTIAQISEYLSRKNKDKAVSIIVPLKCSDNNQSNIFFCHPISGMIYCFNPLISQWNLPISIYGIQDPSISKGHLLYDSVLSMAEHYATQIKKIQPNGPYFLAGYSFGGTIAYEIANILKQQDFSIGLLVLIESWCRFSKAQNDQEHFIKNYLSKELKVSNKLAELTWARMELLLRHTPSETQQNMILFKAIKIGEDYLSIDDPVNGWSQFNKGTIICHALKGDHDSIIDSENSKEIATILYNNIPT